MGLQFGTFGSFTTARLGIYAAQTSLNVTGNNIANMNTRGYTRQRADLVSLYPSGMARYNSNYNQSIGYGVLVDSVSQLRDPFLDIRYRSQNAAAAAFEAKLDGLRQIGHILDEVGKGDDGFGVIEDQLGGFIEMLQSWNNLTSINQYDRLVHSAAKELCSLFNNAAYDLQEVYDNEVGYLEDNVKKANELLNEIRDLNEQIRNANIYGDNALELRDARNVAIDELSSLMKINVTYSLERIDEFTEVEKLTITLPNTKEPTYTKADIERAWNEYKTAYKAAGYGDPDGPNFDPATAEPPFLEFKDFQKEYMSSNANKNIKLIDGIYGTQINIAKSYKENPNYNPDYVDLQEYLSSLTGPDADSVDKDRFVELVQKYAWGDYTLDLEPDDENYENYSNIGGWVENLLASAAFQKDYKGFDMYTDYEHKYLTPNGDGTDDLDEADFVYDDKFLLSIDPLIDKRGRYMRDPVYNTQLTHSIDLKDTDLSGAIQSIREMLTEEGEFASNVDMGIFPDDRSAAYMALLDPDAYRDYLAGDPSANVKRGIPYYMKALDNLAQEFARELNRLNQPSADYMDGELRLDMIYKTYKGEAADGTPTLSNLDGYAIFKDGDNEYFYDQHRPKVLFDTYRPNMNTISYTADDGTTQTDSLIKNADGTAVYLSQSMDITVDLYKKIKTAYEAAETEYNNAAAAGSISNETQARYEGMKTLYGALKDQLGVCSVFVEPTEDPELVPGCFVKENNDGTLEGIRNVQGGIMTYDDVKYANMDPVTLQEPFDTDANLRANLGSLKERGVLTEDEIDRIENGPAFTDEERLALQQRFIDKAQDNVEKLRVEGVLTDEWNFYNGGTLISNSNNNNYTTGITASNISVSRDWSNSSVRVLHSRQPNDVIYDENGKKTIVTHSTAGDNITHMIAKLQGQRDFNATNIQADSAATRFYFRGSFQEFFTNLSGTLADDTNETNSLFEVAELQTLDLDNDRISVSGVDLNEEATNMMQYQKSYSAACQLLTVIDSMLDKLINGTI